MNVDSLIVCTGFGEEKLSGDLEFQKPGLKAFREFPCGFGLE